MEARVGTTSQKKMFLILRQQLNKERGSRREQRGRASGSEIGKADRKLRR